MNELDVGFKNLYFEYITAINDYLMEKQTKHSVGFIDCFVFQATCFAISIVRNREMNNTKSFHRCYIIRCLIECLAVLKMYKSGDLGNINVKLLNRYGYIVEYKIYKRYKDTFDGKAYNFKQIEDNYNKTIKIYNKERNMNEKDIIKMFKNIMPFLDENYNFKEIIDKYLKDYSEYYQILSIFSHAHLCDYTNGILESIDFENIEFNLEHEVFNFIKTYEYNKIPSKGKTMTQELSFYFGKTVQKQMRDLVTKETNAIKKISWLMKEYLGDSNEVYLFKEYADVLYSFMIDANFDSGEVIKCKIKPLFELLAFNDYFTRSSHFIEDKYKIDLIQNHSMYYTKLMLGTKDEDLLRKSYELIKVYEKNLSFEEFDKKFSKKLGFLEKNKTYRDIVEDMLKYYIHDDVKMKKVMIEYDEGVFLSHGNGYMMLSNHGAFGDYSECLSIAHYLIYRNIFSFVKFWDIYVASEDANKYQIKFVEEANKQLKIIETNARLYLNLYVSNFYNKVEY